MDVITVALLAPYGVASVIALGARARYHRRPTLVAVSLMLTLAAVAVYTLLLDALSVSCVWEGLADGPLPIECRSWWMP